MPTKDFRWLREDEIEKLDVLHCTDDDKTGFILEVDLVYPRRLHREHNNFPLAPERRTISHSMCSQYAKGKNKCNKNILFLKIFSNCRFVCSLIQIEY